MPVFVLLPLAQLLHPLILLQHQTHYWCLLSHLTQHFIEYVGIQSQLHTDKEAHQLRCVVVFSFYEQTQSVVCELSHFEAVDDEDASCHDVHVVVVDSSGGLKGQQPRNKQSVNQQRQLQPDLA